MEKEECIKKENLNDVSTHTSSDSSSVYTQHFTHFNLSIKLMRKIRLCDLIIKQNEKDKDEIIFLFKVEYLPENLNVIEWEIYKSCQKIKNLLMMTPNSNFHLQKFDLLINSDAKEYSRKYYLLVELLNELIKIPKLRDQIFFLEFFEISRNTLDCLIEGNKPKEGYIFKKRDQKRKTSFALLCCCLFCKCRTWKKKWFVLRDDMICYMKDSSSAIGKDIFWFDQELILHKDYNKIKNSLSVVNGSRTLILRFEEEYEREIWYNMISQKVKDYQSSVKNIFNSFANEKHFCNAKWFVDAESYYSDLYESLLRSKETIYIAGWWVSPELFLKRPVRLEDYQNHKTKPLKNGVRLMDVLMQKAEENVKVHILVFKELTLAVAIDSSHTKDSLNNLHPNIKVTRHPKNKTDLLWSHHEKLVIIDEEIGYVGGIDLCWGRYDTAEHKLTEIPDDSKTHTWPGIDYSNNRRKDFENLREYHKENIERTTTPRMPWHDISVYLEGPVVSDLCRHFVERWNYARLSTTGTFTKEKKHTIVKVKKKSTISSSFLIPSRSLKEKSGSDISIPLLRESEKENYIDSPLDEGYNTFLRTDIPEKIEKYQENINTEETIIEEKNESDGENEIDLIKFKQRNTFVALKPGIKKEIKKLELNDDTSIILNDVFRRNTMINSSNDKIIEKPTVQAKTAENFSKEKKIKKRRNNSIIDKIKVVYSKVKQKIKTKSNDMFNKFGKISNLIDDNGLLNLKLSDKKMLTQNIYTMNCQVVRSASNWSVGLNKTENSVLQAYYNLIDNAKHYILIENQFFISRSFSEEEYFNAGLSNSYPIINEIALRIRLRIEKAYYSGQKFKVFILIPLLPGFEGEVTDSATLKLILKYTYKTISRNRGFSLIEKLYQLMQDKYEDYIQFFSLRTHGNIKDIPTTELIYIHSKMMLIDDEAVLIGSANINDRSMMGSRDSEVAVIIKESSNENKIVSMMDGKEYLASRFAHSLRVRLFKEYLGISESENSQNMNKLLNDPLSDKLFKFMKEIARSNTMYYREIFNVYPDDKFLSYSDILLSKDKNFMESNELTLMKYEQNKNKIVGYIVEFPLNFLKEENLKISYFCKEILVPIKNFL